MAQLSKYCDCAKSTMAERSSLGSSAILDETAVSLDYTFKDEQKKALQCVCQWKRCVRVVSLPTGYGKSLCYVLLLSVFDIKLGLVENTSIVMVVSPLIALMKDQSMSFTRQKYYPARAAQLVQSL